MRSLAWPAQLVVSIALLGAGCSEPLPVGQNAFFGAVTCTNEGEPCDDLVPCTENDVCTSGACAGTVKTCDDTNGCTVDACVPASGACVHDPAPEEGMTCNDQLACTAGDQCASGVCGGVAVVCASDNNACTAERCTEPAGCASQPLTGTPCSDGDACTENDACNAGTCAAGTPKDCDDDNGCTTDTCNPTTGACGADPSCNDGLFCTIQDTCDASGVCQTTRMNACIVDDDNPCTGSVCNETTDHCDTIIRTGRACDDENVCKTGSTCDATGACTGGTDVADNTACTAAGGCRNNGTCLGGACTSLTDAADDTPCDDRDACTDDEACTSGACGGGTPHVCDDDDPCTTDACDHDLGCVTIEIPGCRPPIDAGPPDARPIDARPIDARPIDARPIDARPIDAGALDGQGADARPPDARAPDSMPIDAPPAADAPPADAAPPAIDLGGGGLDCRVAHRRAPSGGAALALAGAALVAILVRRRRDRALLALALLALVPRAAAADGFDAEIFAPTVTASGGFSQEAPWTSENGVTMGAMGTLGHDLLVARDPVTGEEIPAGDVVSSRFVLHFTAALTLAKRLELGVGVPIVVSQDGTLDAVMPGADLSGSSVGDLRFVAKLRLLTAGPLSVGVSGTVTVPTGEEESFAGEGAATGTPRLLVGVRSGVFALTGSVGYRFRDAHRLANLEVAEELVAGGSAQVELASAKMWFIGEGYVYSGTGDGRDMPAEALAGLRIRVAGPVALQVGGGLGLTRGYGAPAWRGLLGLTFLPGEAKEIEMVEVVDVDRDDDGIVDARDRCPADPEDKDEFEDSDGCPDIDNDGDKVVDKEDACPHDAGAPENGGCPDEDHDGDKIVDRLDKCPKEPEDLDGFQDEDGCPDNDNDGDDVTDANDKCPLVAEDQDGFEDADGCPDPDNDHDGFADEKDKCPNEAEVLNGVDDDDGCPDKGKVLVVLTAEKIEIRQQVFFATNKATIKKQSFGLLAAVAQVLILHPEIKKVRVEGHTDSRGKAERNRVLSKERAESVAKHLVEVNGIDAGRLEAEGFGPDKPIADNKTNKGRALNRRVEFVIVDRKE